MFEYNKVVLCNYILKGYNMWIHWQNIFSCPIQTMHFIEKQNNITLKALILLSLSHLRPMSKDGAIFALKPYCHTPHYAALNVSTNVHFC